jgi:uncharacterized protein YcbK (DUF882 family)
MKIKRIRPAFLKKVIIFLIVFSTIFVIVSFNLLPYFDTSCRAFRQKDYSKRLNDRILDYSDEARIKGVKACKDDEELRERIADGKLVRVRSGRFYIIEDMTYSSPYVTKESKMLLDEIARRFKKKASENGLNGARFIVTSMTRKKENLKSLMRYNGNSSENSPHLYGNAFDISYKRIDARKWRLTNCDTKFLKDALGEVIWQLKQEKKCWATYERNQSCYHIVAR